jgi:GNAT superfamily N-acetyltransferase
MATEAPTDELDLRSAVPADVPLILRFIRELAAYERLEHEVVADEAGLATALFGPRPYAEVVLAEAGGEPAGFALFFHNFSTFVGRPGIYLEDLYVRPAMRGRGVGARLLAHLAALAVERGCGRLEWAVLDWNEPAIGFYRRLGARPMDEWTVFRLEGEALSCLATDPQPPGPDS